MHVYLGYDLFIDQIAFYLVSLTITGAPRRSTTYVAVLCPFDSVSAVLLLASVSLIDQPCFTAKACSQY